MTVGTRKKRSRKSLHSLEDGCVVTLFAFSSRSLHNVSNSCYGSFGNLYCTSPSKFGKLEQAHVLLSSFCPYSLHYSNFLLTFKQGISYRQSFTAFKACTTYYQALVLKHSSLLYYQSNDF